MRKFRPSVFETFRILFGLLAVMDRLLAYTPPFQVPLFDFAILASDLFILGMKCVFFISAFCFVLGYRTFWTGLFAGACHFLLLVASPAHIFAFSYLFPLGLCAFAITGSRQKNSKLDFGAPIALLVSSIYLAASMHKVFHFELMSKWLSIDLARVSRSSILAICPNMDCALTDLIKYAVIPTEFALGFLFFFPRTRKFGLLLAFIFHTFLGSLANVRYVGFLMLCLDSAATVANRDGNIKDFLKKKFYVPLFTIAALLGLVLLEVHSLNIFLAKDFLITILLYLPFLYIGLTMSPKRDTYGADVFPKMAKRSLLFLLVLILFGLSPAIDNYRKLNQWGWAMFSGGYKKNLQVRIAIQTKDPNAIPVFYPLIYREGHALGSIVLTSYAPDFMERFLDALKTHNPEINILSSDQSKGL